MTNKKNSRARAADQSLLANGNAVCPACQTCLLDDSNSYWTGHFSVELGVSITYGVCNNCFEMEARLSDIDRPRRHKAIERALREAFSPRVGRFDKVPQWLMDGNESSCRSDEDTVQNAPSQNCSVLAMPSEEGRND